MPMRSVPIRDAAGNIIGVGCYRESRAHCATTGCRGSAVLLCDYPVTRRGKPARCNRHICRRCATAIGTKEHFCPPHARAASNPTQPGEPQIVVVCAACLSSSCGHRDEGFVCARREQAGTRTLSVSQWKALLSFEAVKP